MEVVSLLRSREAIRVLFVTVGSVGTMYSCEKERG